MKNLVMLALIVFSSSVQAADKCEDLLTKPIADSSTYVLPHAISSRPVTSLPEMPRLTVSAVQYEIEGALSIERMLQKLDRILTSAKEGGSELVIFPELISFDLVDLNSNLSEGQQLNRIADLYTETLVQWFRQKSRSLGLSILGGSHPRREGNKIKNTAYMFFSDGTYVMQDKLFMTPDERSYGWTGGTELKVFQAPWGLSTILICYDSEFPIVSQALSQTFPEFIFIPSMTSTIHGMNRVRWSAQARAIEHFAYVATVGTVHRDGEAGYHVSQSALITPQQGPFPQGSSNGVVNSPNHIQTMIFDSQLLRRMRTQSDLIYPSRDQRDQRKKIKVVNPITESKERN